MFTSIPDALLVSVITEWLKWKDFGRLDSAMCNRKARVEFCQLLSFAAHWSDDQPPSTQWMVKRGVGSRTVRLAGNLQKEPVLRDKFLIRVGSMIQTLQLSIPSSSTNDEQGMELLQGLLDSLCCYCTSLTDIYLCTGLCQDNLSNDAFVSLQTFIVNHPSLQSVVFESIYHMPVSLVHAAVTKLQHVSVEFCAFSEEVPMLPMPSEVHHLTSFTCINTKLPPSLRAFVTHLNLLGLLQDNSHYTNLRCASIDAYCTSIDVSFAENICTFWSNVIFLRLHTMYTIGDAVILMLIRGLRNLTILDMLGDIVANELGDHYRPYTVPDNLNGTTLHTPNGSPLHTLCIRCEQATTLEEIVQRCPNLTFLSLAHPLLNISPLLGIVSVESSLHLLCNTRVHALHLLGYALSNDNIAALQHMPLHTLSISAAEVKLTNEGILRLVPTLASLHTLNLSYCDGLSYKIVLHILPLCLTLRGFTFRTAGGNVKTSTSHFLLSDVLSQMFPHVKVFSIRC